MLVFLVRDTKEKQHVATTKCQGSVHASKIIYTLLLYGLLLTACNNNNTKLVVEKLTIEDVAEHDPGPPPPSFSCDNPVTIQSWFQHFCQQPSMDNTAGNYKFILFETASCFAVALENSIGDNKDSVALKMSDLQKDIEYTALSKTGYAGLNWEEVLSKMRAEIKVMAANKDFNKWPIARQITIRFADGELLQLK